MNTMRCVLLTHSNHLYSDPKQVEKMQPYPPLGTIVAAAVLRADGIAAHLFDATFESSESAFRAAIARVKPDLVAVCEDDFNFLSKMCLTRNRELAFRWARISRDEGIACVAHGSDATDRACAYLDAGFDGVLIGELEQSLLEIAQGRCRSEINGLLWRDENGTLRNRPRAPLPDLDLLPAPAWDLLDMEAYRAAWKERHGYFSLNLVSSRGCPYGCNWCAKPIYGNRYRARSAKSVAAEMLHLKRKYSPDQVWFADDIFALSARWTRDFACEVERLGAAIPFKIQSRCDLMARETVAALRRTGCEEVWMGAESGSQRVLDRMEKDLAVEQIYAARDNLRRHGIRACFFLQLGYAGETWDDIEATIRMVRETSPDDVGISVSYPLPETKFHQIVSSRMGAKANWDHSADLSMMFHGAFSTEFYRAVADALHVEVRGGDRFAAWSHVEQLRLEAVA